jgi:hypothetical protein
MKAMKDEITSLAVERTRPQFAASRYEMGIITKIVKRARKMDPDYSAMDATMDIEATHCSRNPLDLGKLLAADDFNFAHDVFGIRRHIDRTTGRLTRFFSPRCSLPEK